jgi:hypothetical protein
LYLAPIPRIGRHSTSKMGDLRLPLIVWLLLGLGSTFVGTGSALHYYLNPLMGLSGNGDQASPFKKFDNICRENLGNSASSSNTLTIETGDPVLLEIDCTLVGSWAIYCTAPACTLRTGAHTIHVTSGAYVASSYPLNIESSPGTSPIFVVSEQSVLNIHKGSISAYRSIAKVENRSQIELRDFEISIMDVDAESPHVFVGKQNSTVSLTRCNLYATTISRGSVFFQENSSLLFLDSVSMIKTQFGITLDLNPVRLIFSRDLSKVVVRNSNFSEHVINSDSIQGNHPSLIDIDTGQVEISNTQFYLNSIECRFSYASCPLGSLIIIRNSQSYKLKESSFLKTYSPGCNVIHVSNSSGEIVSNSFNASVISGTVKDLLPTGELYPPTTLSSAQAVVCITRNLANLESDFGVQLGGSKGGPFGTGFVQDVRMNSWHSPSYSKGAQLRLFGGKLNDTLLFAADLWASNVQIALTNNIFSDFLYGTVRVDACDVQIGGTGVVSLGSWIDFGSRVEIGASVTSISVTSLAIYGAAPLSTSNYHAPTSNNVSSTFIQIMSSATTPESVITGGVFAGLQVRMATVEGTLILGSPFPEPMALKPSSSVKNMFWAYDFKFSNGAQLSSEDGTIVDIVTMMAPLEFTDTSSMFLNSQVRASRLGSRESASGSLAATIKGDHLKMGSQAQLYVVDLCVIGDLEFLGSALLVEPSRARSVTHGLNVTGSLKGISQAISLTLFEGKFLGLPYGEISLQERIPIISAASLSNFDNVYDTSVTVSATGLTFKFQNFATFGNLKQASWIISKARLTIYSHTDGAAIVARFPSIASRYDEWGIGANCGGLFVPPLGGMNCQWVSNQDLLIWSNDTLLPSNLNTLPFESRWTWILGGVYGLGSLNSAPTAILKWLPPFMPVDVSFWLDATPSYFLAWRGVTPTIEWSNAPGTFSATDQAYFDAHKTEWRFEILPYMLQVGQSYVFTATIFMADGVQLSKSIQFTSEGPVNCNPPTIFLDSPQEVNYYESIPLNLRVIVNPSCSANLTGQAQFQYAIDSDASSDWSPEPILRLPAFERGSKPFGETAQLTVVVMWQNASIPTKSAALPLRFRTLDASFTTTDPYEVFAISDYQPVTLSSYVDQNLGNGNLTMDWVEKSLAMDPVDGFRCPLPVFEDLLEYPDPPYSAPGTTYASCFNTETNPKSVYQPKLTPSAATQVQKFLNNLTLWFPAEHTMTVNVKNQQPDNEYRHSRRVSFKIRPDNSVEYSLRRTDLKLQFIAGALSLPYGLLPPSQTLALEARLLAGQACIGCSYQWKVVGVADNTFSDVKTSFLTIPPNSLPFASDISVEAVITHSDGMVSSDKVSYRTHSRPYGGTFTIIPATSANGTFDAHATRWTSEHPMLQYMITEQDCNPPFAHRLVAWPTYSSSWKSLRATIRGCESNPVLFLHVIDGIGSTTSVSVEMTSYTPINLSWTSHQMIDLAASISETYLSGQWDLLLEKLQLVNSIPEADSFEWSSARESFVSKIENSGIFRGLVTVPHWPFLFHVAFGDSQLLHMFKSVDLTEKMLGRPLLKAPSRSELEGYYFATGWQLMNAAYDARFGPQVSKSTRGACVQSFVGKAEQHLALRTQLQFMASSSGRTSWSYEASRTSVRVRAVDIFTAQTVEEWSLVRDGNLGVSLSPASAMSWHTGLSGAVWLQQVVFEQWTHPIMPTDHLLAPFDKTIHFVAQPSFYSTTLTAFFYFPIAAELLNANPDLQCAHTTAFAWLSAACTTTKSTSSILCECEIPGGTAVSVTVLNPIAFCPQPIPVNANFVCSNGAWVLEGNVETPSIVIPSTSVTIIGNLTVDTIQFGGLAGTVNVTGCTRIGTSITIELTLEELEALIASGEITSLLLTSTGCDITDLKNIPISVTVNGGDRCEKVTVTSETTTTTLSGVFKVDTSGCKKKSSMWWIVLVSVLGGVIVLAAIFTLLATFTPLKHIVRPHAKRAEDANTYYINESAAK